MLRRFIEIGVVAMALIVWLGALAPAVDLPQPPEDVLRMPFYTGRILPTPQKVVYSDRFASLSNTGLLLGADIMPDDPRLNVLRTRLARYGGRVKPAASLSEDCSAFLCLGETEPGKGMAAPDKDEGYVIQWSRRNGKDVAILKAHDRRGLLWAIVSLNQLVTQQDGKAVVQMADVVDYPAIRNRGFVSGCMPLDPPPVADWPRQRFASPLNEYIVHCKLSKVCFSTSLLADRRIPAHSWKAELPEAAIEDLRQTGAYLTPLGIEWYAELQPLTWETPDLQVRSKNEDDFQAVFKKSCAVMDAGGYVALMYDDLRFDMSQEDVQDFGTAREADIYFINKLYDALKAKYTGRPVKILFCPPFYWGPGSSHAYPESREEYLAAIGKRLPQDVGIFWTGSSVKTGPKTREATDWYTQLIRRKPFFFQNGVGAKHIHYFHYVTDPLPEWRDWSYEGFYQDLDTYMLNVGLPGDCAKLATLADYLWNPTAYVPVQAVEQAAKKLCGPESWAGLIELNEKLSYFDLYSGRATPAAARNLKEMEAKIKEVEAALARAQAAHPQAVAHWTSMPWYVSIQKNFIEEVRKNPQLSAFHRQAEDSKKIAQQEVPLIAATDTFLAATEFLGGASPTLYGYRGDEKRLVTWIYGARTGRSTMQAPFEVDPWPAAGDYQLIISGQDDESPKSCRIRVLVNDTQIFEGANAFTKSGAGWSRRTFKIPGAALKRSNTLIIKNIEDTDRASGPPFFLLNYAVLRRTK